MAVASHIDCSISVFIWQLRTTEFTWEKSTIWIILGSGTCLWIPFASWVWSLDHTSLTHSLLFVTAHPLIIVTGMFALRMNPHGWEVGGRIGRFGGNYRCPRCGSGEVTLLGDAAAFVGAIAIVGYLAAGRYSGQSRYAIVSYAFPVTAIAGIQLSLHAMVSEGQHSIWRLSTRPC
ncbi:MAG: hypothetical protein Ct9H90mP16_19550 [Candidatus Poseidoniales archaeon]|nr:MAG: hypothetical protein Ct9H90mP16_19550 [Candidatus Poseidoniales archaeon]